MSDKKLAHLGALLLVVLAGCEAGKQIPGNGQMVIVTYDEDFDRNFLPDGTPESRGVVDGIHYWNALGANLRLPEDLTDAEWAANYDAAPRFSVHRDQFSWPGLTITGMCWDGLGYVTVYTSVMRDIRSLDYQHMREDVAHELGHAIGMRHISGPGVMNAWSNWYADRPSDGDEAEYQRVY